MRPQHLIALVLAVLLAPACGSSRGRVETPPPVEPVAITPRGPALSPAAVSPGDMDLRGIWAASPWAVFAVGRTALLRFDGMQWTADALAAQRTLFDVFGRTDDDVVAVGRGFVATWDGLEWTEEPGDRPWHDDYYGAWLAPDGTAFVVGDSCAIYRRRAGGPGRWESMDVQLPEEVREDDLLGLRDIWGTSPEDVYAVGFPNLVLHFDGTAWQFTLSGDGLNGVSGSGPGNVVAVGFAGTILRFDGETWREEASGVAEELNDVAVVDAHRAYAVGREGVALRYDGSRWTRIDSGTERDLHAVWAVAPTEVIAVGDGGTVVQLPM